jgi:glycosyltransferase involved in cell wall biosynthesis
VSQVSGDDLVREYATHDILVLPSLFEGMPLTLAEAMAARMVVVTTATCGMLDLIRHGENGLLVPPRDAESLAGTILDLLHNPVQQRLLGEQARETISQQTWDKIAGQFLSVFERYSPGLSKE